MDPSLNPTLPERLDPIAPERPDHQLRLAVLAVERRLATPEQALRAAAGWLADPTRGVGLRLEQAGVLDAATRAALELEGETQAVESEATLAPRAAPGPGAPATTPGTVTPEAPGRYSLLGERGKGGQARILVALDRHLGREVAWKELTREDAVASPGGSQSASPLDRFLREARVTGQLEHPNIVPVYELGQRPDGSLYYTMRLVRGRTLGAALKGRNLPGRLRLLGHFRDVCHALAFAHARGIVHRDIKPANVMVGEFGETVLLDWGIAKLRGGEVPGAPAAPTDSLGGSGETLVGDALGTPSYMSPEQAEGRTGEVDERSDVWGLGALLYEILTGRPPYTGGTALAVLAKVSRDPLVPVREICPEAPPELAAVAEKALQKAQADRYGTARELVEDVTAFMSGVRVSAYAYSSWELLRRFAARNRPLLAAVASIAVAVVAGLIATGLAWRQESAARVREQAARAGETIERRNARYHLAQAYQREAERLEDGGGALAARVLAAASLLNNPAHPASLDPDPTFAALSPEAGWLRMDALSLLFQTRDHPVERLLAALPASESVLRLAFSPDGKLLAAGDFSGALRVWDAETLEVRFTVQAHPRLLSALAFTPDSRRLITGGADRMVKIWDLQSRALLRTLPPSSAPPSAGVLDRTGRVLATGHNDGQVLLWDLETGSARALTPAHTDQVRGMAFDPSGTALVTGSWDKSARIWDVASGRVRATLAGHADAVYGVDVSPDGRQVVTSSYDRTARLWDLATGEAEGTIDLGSEAHGAAFSPNGNLVGVATASGTVVLFDPRTRRLESTIQAHQASASTVVAFHPGGDRFASGGFDQAVRVWKLSAQQGPARFPHTDWVYGVAFSRDGERLYTAGWDREVRAWDRRTGRLVHRLGGFEGGAYSVAVSPDGAQVAAAAFDGTARVWSTATGELRGVLRPNRGSLRAIAFSPDGTLLATGATGDACDLWDARTLARGLALQHEGTVHALAFSPDGKNLATASSDRQLRIWSVRDGTVVSRLSGHSDWISGVAYSPDGKLLASGGKDTQVLLWDAQTGAVAHALRGHKGWVDEVAFSPDGRLLASAGEDARVIVWDVGTGQPLLRLRTSRESIRTAFSPDGHDLAVTEFSAAVVYHLELPWNVSGPAQVLAEGEARAGAKLDGFELPLVPPPSDRP